MGVSTNAYLVFGINLGAEDEWENDRLNDLTELADNLELDSEHVEMVDHCHHEYRMWIVAVKGTLHQACRGDPTIIDPATLTVSPEQISALRCFCDERGVEWQEPGWLLCSMWS